MSECMLICGVACVCLSQRAAETDSRRACTERHACLGLRSPSPPSLLIHCLHHCNDMRLRHTRTVPVTFGGPTWIVRMSSARVCGAAPHPAAAPLAAAAGHAAHTPSAHTPTGVRCAAHGVRSRPVVIDDRLAEDTGLACAAAAAAAAAADAHMRVPLPPPRARPEAEPPPTATPLRIVRGSIVSSRRVGVTVQASAGAQLHTHSLPLQVRISTGASDAPLDALQPHGDECSSSHIAPIEHTHRVYALVERYTALHAPILTDADAASLDAMQPHTDTQRIALMSMHTDGMNDTQCMACVRGRSAFDWGGGVAMHTPRPGDRPQGAALPHSTHPQSTHQSHLILNQNYAVRVA